MKKQQILSRRIRTAPRCQTSPTHRSQLSMATTISSRLRPPLAHPAAPESTCTRDAKALFIMIGAVAKTQWLPTSLERDANGYVRTGRDMTIWSLDREPFALETSIPGIFCAGDVRHGSVKRVASSVGEGSIAIAFIHEYLALTDMHSQGSASPFHRAV